MPVRRDSGGPGIDPGVNRGGSILPLPGALVGPLSFVVDLMRRLVCD